MMLTYRTLPPWAVSGRLGAQRHGLHTGRYIPVSTVITDQTVHRANKLCYWKIWKLFVLKRLFSHLPSVGTNFSKNIFMTHTVSYSTGQQAFQVIGWRVNKMFASNKVVAIGSTVHAYKNRSHQLVELHKQDFFVGKVAA